MYYELAFVRIHIKRQLSKSSRVIKLKLIISSADKIFTRTYRNTYLVLLRAPLRHTYKNRPFCLIAIVHIKSGVIYAAKRDDMSRTIKIFTRLVHKPIHQPNQNPDPPRDTTSAQPRTPNQHYHKQFIIVNRTTQRNETNS